LVRGLYKPISAKDLEGLVRRVMSPMEVGRAKLEDKLMSFDVKACKSLADVLLGEVLSDIPAGSHLVVVPDGCVGLVPFEMLTLDAKGQTAKVGDIPVVLGAQFLGDRNPMSYYQSLTALTLARNLGTREKPGDRLLVMADPVFEMRDARAQQMRGASQVAGVEARLYQDLMAAVEEGKVRGVYFGRLPLTGELADRIKSMYGQSCTVYSGIRASKETFLKDIAGRLSSYGRVVFATHGYGGNDLPGIKEPVLVLTLVPPGTDGYLRMSEVMGLPLRADLAVLTACQTGLGRQLFGEGVMNMGRAFQYAGVRSVLVSQWSVSERSSTILVETFFKYLKAGKGKMEALKLAREDLRKQGYEHPFFWAPFILVGEAE